MFKNLFVAFAICFATSLGGTTLSGCGSNDAEKVCQGLNGACATDPGTGVDTNTVTTVTTGTNTGSATAGTTGTVTSTETGTASITIPADFAVGKQFSIRFTVDGGSIFAEFDSATVTALSTADGSFTIKRGICITGFGCGALQWAGAGTISSSAITLTGVNGVGSIPYECGGDTPCFAGGTWKNETSFAGTFLMAN